MSGDNEFDTLRNLLRVQTGLRDQAEQYNREAKNLLVRMLEMYGPDEVDRRLKAGEPLDSLPIKVLVELIRQKIDERLLRAERILAGRGLEVEQMEKLTAEAKRDRDDLARATQRIEELERENRTLRAEFAAYRQSTSVAAPKTSPSTPTVIAPSKNAPVQEPDQTNSDPPANTPEDSEWMSRWKESASFDRDSICLRLIGETGLSRRPLIEARLADLFGIKAAGGSIDNLLKRMRDLVLIDILQPWEPGSKPASRGSFPDLIRLTERGRKAYRELFGAEPLTSEYDALLVVHQSPEHTLLNLNARDILREAGYALVSEAPDIQLPNGKGLFKPDIVVRDADNNLLYIEVERDTRKSMRAEKWRNASDAGGGRIYVICENRSCMATIRNEVGYALTEFTLSLSSIPDVQAGKRGENDSIWLEVKKKERRSI